MATTEKLEITLSTEQAELIRQRVARGDYASVDQMVSAALHTLDDESWLPAPDVLRRLVQEAIDDPRPTLSSEEMRRAIDEMVAAAERDATRRAG